MATRKHTHVHTHASSNAVTLVWSEPDIKTLQRQWKRVKTAIPYSMRKKSYTYM